MFGDIAWGTLLGAGGAVGLSAFYVAVRAKWPANYASAETTLSRQSRLGPVRYLTFRLVPLYLTGVFIAATARRLNISIGAAIYCLLALHILLTNGRAAVTLRRRHPSRRPAYSSTMPGPHLPWLSQPSWR